jgi:broad specificity phosphatase PhoE
MLSRDVTWGELRELHQLNTRTGGGIPDDVLADPDARERSRGKADDDFYFDLSEEEIAAYKQAREENDIDSLPGTVSVTISQQGEILELVKVTDDGRLFVREDKGWYLVGPDQDEPRIHDQTLANVSEDFVEYYDRLRAAKAEITKEVMQEYAV